MPEGELININHMGDVNLQEVLKVSVEVAYEAGGMMLAASKSLFDSNQKKNSADLVTATDHAIEHMISQRLTICFPHIDFLGEEAYSNSSSPSTLLTSRPTFICDPIDGTMNFVHSHRQFCISLGLAIEKEPVLGVIYDPMTQELYSGVQGQGAFVSVAGGERMRLPLPSISRRSELSMWTLKDCLVGLEWGSDRHGENYELKMQVFRKMSAHPAQEQGGQMVAGIRSNGSTALLCAAVAVGSLDVYWEAGCWPWDVSAGWLLVRESGGRVVGGNEGVWDGDVQLEDRCYIMVRGVSESIDGQGRQKQDEIIKGCWSCLEGKTFTYSG